MKFILKLDIIGWLFGCRHPKDSRSWPRSDNNGPVYVTCHECGKKLPYNNPVLFDDSPNQVHIGVSST